MIQAVNTSDTSYSVDGFSELWILHSSAESVCPDVLYEDSHIKQRGPCLPVLCFCFKNYSTNREVLEETSNFIYLACDISFDVDKDIQNKVNRFRHIRGTVSYTHLVILFINSN